MTQHRLHTNTPNVSLTLDDPHTGYSTRRKAKRTLIGITVEFSHDLVLSFDVDQENFLQRVAEATGSVITRPKAPAVYDGLK